MLSDEEWAGEASRKVAPGLALLVVSLLTVGIWFLLAAIAGAVAQLVP